MKPLGPVAGASLGERVRAAVAKAAEHADEVDREGRFPTEALAAMREGRLLGIAVPPAQGGEGATLADIAWVCNELARPAPRRAWSSPCTRSTWPT